MARCCFFLLGAVASCIGGHGARTKPQILRKKAAEAGNGTNLTDLTRGNASHAVNHTHALGGGTPTSASKSPLGCQGLSTTALVYNVEKDGREEKGQQPLVDAAKLIAEGLTEHNVDFASVPEASFELLRQVWKHLGAKHQSSIGLLYEVVFSEWTISDKIKPKADLGVAMLYRKDHWTLEKRTKCSDDFEKPMDFKPLHEATEDPTFMPWVTASCSKHVGGEHLKLSLKVMPERPMISARFVSKATAEGSLKKLFVTAVHAGHKTHMVGKDGSASDADQIASGLAAVHDETKESAYWIFGDMNTHFGLHGGEKAEALLAAVMSKTKPHNCASMEECTFDLKVFGENINKKLKVAYKLEDTKPTDVEEPATCCCPPMLPWIRFPKPVSSGCAGGESDELSWTPVTDWKTAFQASNNRCDAAQKELVPDMQENAGNPHRCMPSFAFADTKDLAIPESDLFDVEGKKTVKQYAFDHVLIGVPAGYKLHPKTYGMLEVPFRASDHLPLMSSFEICKLLQL